MCSSSDVCLGLLAVIFPPLAVWIKTGICSCASLLNILLCLLGYLPGLIHAWYIIASVPDEAHTVYVYEQISPGDIEAGRGQGVRASRVPGPAGHVANTNGYVAPPPQLGPRDGGSATTYGTIDQASSSVNNTQGENAQAGAPPSYDQAIRGDNKVQR